MGRTDETRGCVANFTCFIFIQLLNMLLFNELKIFATQPLFHLKE